MPKKTHNNHPHLAINNMGMPYRIGQKLSPEETLRIAALLCLRVSFKEISRTTQRTRTAIRRIKKKMETGKNIFEQNFKAPETGVHSQQFRIDFLYNLIIRYPVVDLKKLKKIYEDTFQETISMSMMHYLITKHLGFIWKRTEIVEWARTREVIKQMHER